MSVIDTYPLDVKKFIIETLALPLEGKAAYLMLLVYYCSQGKAPADDDIVLSMITGSPNWIRLRPMLSDLFEVRDGKWYHNGIEAEMARQSKVRTVAITASKAAKSKREERKGLVQTIVAPSQEPVPLTIAQEAKQVLDNRRIEEMTKALSAPPAPVDHPIPDDFSLDGADVIECQNRGANLDETAEWLDYFRSYHAEAGTMATDWKALFYRFVDRKVMERDAKPKAKPRIEVSRRAPAPPGAA